MNIVIWYGNIHVLYQEEILAIEEIARLFFDKSLTIAASAEPPSPKVG